MFEGVGLGLEVIVDGCRRRIGIECVTIKRMANEARTAAEREDDDRDGPGDRKYPRK